MSKKRTSAVTLRCEPLTPDRWDDFATLFGENGACGGCWCMTWRVRRSEFNKNKGEGNRLAMHGLVESGEVPGIIGYLDDEPVGWCAVAPREQYPALERSRVLKRVDDLPVWSVSCFFVRKDQRNKGLTVQLLRAAVEYVRQLGGRIVEGYPVEPRTGKMPAVFAWTGIASAFIKAGFEECKRHSETRPIMRYEIVTVS